MKPNSSEFDVGAEEVVVDDVGVVLDPNSTKPSRFVGTTISLFGILTTPRLWSSRTSIIFFFFLKSMLICGICCI